MVSTKVNYYVLAGVLKPMTGVILAFFISKVTDLRVTRKTKEAFYL